MADSGPERRPTLETVADIAGTSTAVVSYVINNGPRNVAPETKDRVLAAIQQAGYRPNRLARALASQQSRTLGLVVPDTTNAFFRELSRAIEAAAFERDFLTLIGNAALDESHEQSYLAAFVDAGVDALIVTSTTIDSWDQDLVPPGTPVVSLHKRPTRPGGFTILADDLAGASDVTLHLLDHGYETVWCMTGPLDEGPMAERRAGWEAALQQRGIAPSSAHVVRSQTQALDASRRIEAVLARPDRPRALFVATDEQAIGVIHAAGRLGIAIPGDLSIASFDGTSAAEVTFPPLTTAAIPIPAMARAAVDLAVGDDRSRPERIFPVELNIRRSCGCP